MNKFRNDIFGKMESNPRWSRKCRAAFNQIDKTFEVPMEVLHDQLSGLCITDKCRIYKSLIDMLITDVTSDISAYVGNKRELTNVRDELNEIEFSSGVLENIIEMLEEKEEEGNERERIAYRAVRGELAEPGELDSPDGIPLFGGSDEEV